MIKFDIFYTLDSSMFRKLFEHNNVFRKFKPLLNKCYLQKQISRQILWVCSQSGHHQSRGKTLEASVILIRV